jgi:MFS family permease
MHAIRPVAVPTQTVKPPGRLYRWYIVAVLLLAYVVSFMDRTVLAVLVDPIRTDLAIGDVAISTLIGFGFVLVYSTAGLVLGRVADSGDRRLLIVAGLLIWSLATAASGFATGVAGLLLARILVGIGEAALSPASYSLISSYFPAQHLGAASSVYALGTVLGGGIATYVIGVAAQLASHTTPLSFLAPGTGGWRQTFLIVGMVGLPLIFLLLTIREPRKAATVSVMSPESDAAPTLTMTLRHLLEHAKVYAGIMGGYSIMTITSYGAALWGPTYFIRTHGFSPSSVGSLFGLVMGVGGTAGVLSGGMLADRLLRRGLLDAAPRVVLASLLLQTPLFALAYLQSNTRIAIGFFAAAVFVMALQGALQALSIQLLAPARMRGLTMAIYLMSANIVGMGFGTLLIAILTEDLFHRADAIGYSLAIASVVSSLSAAAMVRRVLPAFRSALLEGKAV